jgi:hypothetical protein
MFPPTVPQRHVYPTEIVNNLFFKKKNLPIYSYSSTVAQENPKIIKEQKDPSTT